MRIKKRAENNWQFWRLVFVGKMNYSDVSNMSYEEIIEANKALDIYIEKIQK